MDTEGYDDDWPTCEKTHAAFRLFQADLDPQRVTELVGIEPSYTYRRGDSVGRIGAKRESGAWIVSSRGHLVSKDLKRHIDWLLELVEPVSGALRTVVADGANADVFCFWMSKHGHGGPDLSPRQMARLAELGLTIGLDVYSAEAFEEDERRVAEALAGVIAEELRVQEVIGRARDEIPYLVADEVVRWLGSHGWSPPASA